MTTAQDERKKKLVGELFKKTCLSPSMLHASDVEVIMGFIIDREDDILKKVEDVVDTLDKLLDGDIHKCCVRCASHYRDKLKAIVKGECDG